MDIDLAALRALERERDISLDVLIPAIEQALLVAYHRTEGAHRHARVELDRKTGHVVVWAREEGDRPRPRRASAARARPRVRRHARPGSAGSRPSTARQVIVQRLRDLEDEADHGRLQRPRGRRRRRRHPAEPRPPQRARSTSAPSRASCRWPSRCRARSTSTASGCAASW